MQPWTAVKGGLPGWELSLGLTAFHLKMFCVIEVLLTVVLMPGLIEICRFILNVKHGDRSMNRGDFSSVQKPHSKLLVIVTTHVSNNGLIHYL
jgi:hypothetical protein